MAYAINSSAPLFSASCFNIWGTQSLIDKMNLSPVLEDSLKKRIFKITLNSIIRGSIANFTLSGPVAAFSSFANGYLLAPIKAAVAIYFFSSGKKAKDKKLIALSKKYSLIAAVHIGFHVFDKLLMKRNFSSLVTISYVVFGIFNDIKQSKMLSNLSKKMFPFSIRLQHDTRRKGKGIRPKCARFPNCSKDIEKIDSIWSAFCSTRCRDLYDAPKPQGPVCLSPFCDNLIEIDSMGYTQKPFCDGHFEIEQLIWKQKRLLEKESKELGFGPIREWCSLLEDFLKSKHSFLRVEDLVIKHLDGMTEKIERSFLKEEQRNALYSKIYSQVMFDVLFKIIEQKLELCKRPELNRTALLQEIEKTFERINNNQRKYKMPVDYQKMKELQRSFRSLPLS
ncbi:MAG: hypothetical protein JXA94_01180 [Parachlamydiales bacterium]|nr:hypothetical protein [Parachlamydiales bacterium]